MREKKTALIVIPLAIFCFAIAGYFMYISSYVRKWDDKIYPKAIIQGIDVGGETRESAIARLQSATQAVENKKIIVKALNNSYELDFKNSKPKYNIKETVENAFLRGKESNVLTKYRSINNDTGKSYELSFSYEDITIKNFLDKIESETNKEPKNAVLTMPKSGVISISKEEVGKKLDRADLQKQIESSLISTQDILLNAKVQDLQPTITEAMLKNINSLVSSYSTRYSGSTVGRGSNIAIATKFLNGILLMPGDTFSFNDIVGKRTPERGFQEAPVIIKNKLEVGQGGGVCQVSTTLYNAIIRLNIRSLSRANHSLTPAYVPLGFDATVSENIDYKFKNTLQYPIYIEGYARKGIINFNIYSNATLKAVKYDLVNEVYETTEPETSYKDDPTLLEGTLIQEVKPVSGHRVKVYLVGIKDGVEISRVQISNDRYKVVNEVIRRGTKKVR